MARVKTGKTEQELRNFWLEIEEFLPEEIDTREKVITCSRWCGIEYNPDDGLFYY